MRYALLIVFVALIATPQQASAVESARDLANYCEALQQGAKGRGHNVRIPGTKAALQCWGYMQAMQNMSVLIDESGRRVIGSCPPEETTLLQLIRAFVTYARSHPKQLEGNAAVAVINSFKDAFPCDQPPS